MYHINKEITGSGENLTLKNTAKHYFKKFDILGNSIQEGTPSIEYEAPIESVGDNIQLLDFTNYQTFKATNTYYAIKANNFDLKPNIEYIFNYSASGDFSTANGIKLWFRDANNSSFKEVLANTTFSLIEAELNKLSYIQVVVQALTSGVTYSGHIYPKIEKGTKATPYSPYGQGNITIKQNNKNFLYMGKNLKKEYNGLTITTDEEGTITLNGTTVNSMYLSLVKDLSTYNVKLPEIFLPVGTYTFSVDRISGTTDNNNVSVYVRRAYNDKEGFLGISRLPTATKLSTTGKLDEMESFCCYLWANANITFNNFKIKAQLELNASATEIIVGEKQECVVQLQQPFRAIGDVRDRFIKKAGVWYEEHNYNTKLITGDEAWIYVESTKTWYVENFFTDKLSVSEIKSTHYPCMLASQTADMQDGYMAGNKGTSAVNRIYLKDLQNAPVTLAEFKPWIKNLNIVIYYQLNTPLLIPCTPEQVEQLEYFEKEAYSYDETTNIYSTDEVSPYFEVTAYQKISEEFKTRLKEGKITRGYLKVLATNTLPEIIINENNYLKDLKIEELRYVPEEGIIGGAVAKRVSGNFSNVDSSFDIQDREIEVYLGVELEDEITEYIKYGTYIVQRPEDDQVNDNTSFEALDYMVKFNQEYKDRITYPCTLKQLLDDIVDQAGVNSKVATFANSEFVVENNQFEQGTTLRDVLKAIAQVAFNWTRIDQDNNLVMDFEMKNTVDEELGPDDYFEFKKTDEYGPINTIILRNSQVEGENVTIKDDELINTPKGYNLINAKYDVDIRANDPYTIKVEPNTYYLLTLKQICIALGTSTRSQHWYKIFDKDGNILKQTNIIPFDFTEVNEIKSGKQSLLMPENADYIIIDLGSFNSSASNTLRHLEAQFVKGKEEKPYQPYIPVGEVELVIADNPFAYTELKRKQLIEAGRRLFGLRYTPMAVDMLGLMYLNAKDRISVKNLNGEKYSTYLFDHTIDYTGIVLDSMESKAKTKTETKYQYISSLAQGLSHVEIKVDKANKKIESIVQTQEDVSEKVAKTVARIEVVYALSDSPTTEPTNGWSTTAPEWTAGKYMWQKTITTYANGTTAETAATNISGAKGAPGQNGVGIIQTNITYQKSTSGTTVPTGTWQTTIPEVNEDGYLWTRTEFIYSDGSKKYAYNVGKKGAAGIGVKSLVDQYYLSTSNTEQTGGEWTETQPEWQDKTYIWTRTKINWTDNSITYTDPVLANTLNDINSNIVVLRELSSSQIVENGKIITRIEETTKKLNNDYSTTEQVDSKIDGLEDKYETLVKRFVDIEASNKEYAIKINAIDNNGVDKIKTLMGYTFNDEGLNIDRPGADTATLVNEKGVEVSDKTGASSTPLLYAGYVEEGNDKFPNYEGQTIVATSNLIVKNFLVIGSNSRFQDYINPVLGGQGTGAYDI